MSKCGPRCLVYILSLNNIPMELKKAAELCKTTKNGTLAFDLASAFASLGFETEIRENMQWEQLQYLTEDYWPVIMWWSTFYTDAANLPAGHYSIIMEANALTAQVYDPDFGRIVTYPRQTIESMWVDYEDYGKYNKDWIHTAILVKKPQGDKTVTTLKSISGKKRGAQPNNDNASKTHVSGEFYRGATVDMAQEHIKEGLKGWVGMDVYGTQNEREAHTYGALRTWQKAGRPDKFSGEYAVVSFSGKGRWVGKNNDPAFNTQDYVFTSGSVKPKHIASVNVFSFDYNAKDKLLTDVMKYSKFTRKLK